jgi:hypothetical protein
MVLRGNLYGTKGISRDLYEEALAFFSNNSATTVEMPSIADLYDILRESAYKRRIFAQIVRFFTTEFDPANDIENLTKEDSTKCVAWAHTLALMIDLYENTYWTPKWEEYRLCFVAMMVHWNKKKGDIVYMYRPKDLHGERGNKANYLDSFPTDLINHSVVGRVLGNRITRLIRNPTGIVCRFAKWFAIRNRSRKYLNRHELKEVTSTGVQITTDGHPLHLPFDDNLIGLRNLLVGYLSSSKRRKNI